MARIALLAYRLDSNVLKLYIILVNLNCIMSYHFYRKLMLITQGPSFEIECFCLFKNLFSSYFTIALSMHGAVCLMFVLVLRLLYVLNIKFC